MGWSSFLATVNAHAWSAHARELHDLSPYMEPSAKRSASRLARNTRGLLGVHRIGRVRCSH
eukprot:7227967-Prorocentrum_lima.AAC.1